MDSPGGYPESLLDQDGDQDDVVYPCKGCGEVTGVVSRCRALANNVHRSWRKEKLSSLVRLPPIDPRGRHGVHVHIQAGIY